MEQQVQIRPGVSELPELPQLGEGSPCLESPGRTLVWTRICCGGGQGTRRQPSIRRKMVNRLRGTSEVSCRWAWHAGARSTTERP